jgi:predicted amidophosphoribosyltransferase
MKKVVTGLLIGLIVSIIATIIFSNWLSILFAFTTLITLLSLVNIGVNGYKGCPSCDKLVSGSTSFCPRCGMDLKAPPPKKQPGGNLSHPCSDRSTGLKTSPHSLPPAIPAVPSNDADPLTTPTVPACPNCQATIQANDTCCSSCGYSLEQTQTK